MSIECEGAASITNLFSTVLGAKNSRGFVVGGGVAVRRSFLAVCTFIAAALSATAAQAEERGPTASLSWVRLDGADTCVTTQGLANGVEQALERKVFVSAADAQLSVEGHVARTAGAWRARVSMRDAKGALLGTRDLESRDTSCDVLGKQLALVVSLMIDAEAPKPPPAPVLPASPPAREIVVERETVYVPTAPVPPRSWKLAVGASTVVGVGVMPETATALRGTVIVDPPRFWAVALSGTMWMDQSIAAERGGRADVALAYGGLALCPLATFGPRLSWRGCAGGQVGSLRTRGVGFDDAFADERLLVNATLEGAFGVRVAGPLLATAGLAFLVPLAKSELAYRTADGAQHQLFRAAPLAITGELGLALLFP